MRSWCFHTHRLPCRLRVFRQNERTWPSRRTAEKQESSVERRAEGKPSGQTPAHSSPLPQSSVSSMAKCCSITCWACWKGNNVLMFIHPLGSLNVLASFLYARGKVRNIYALESVNIRSNGWATWLLNIILILLDYAAIHNIYRIYNIYY